MHQTTYAGNDQYILWSRGNGCLSIFNTSTFTIEDIKDFWVYTSKYRRLSPVTVIANQQATKVFAVGLDDLDINSSEVLTFYAGGKKQQIAANGFHSHISSWQCLESSFEGYCVFVGGEHKEKAVLGAVSFDEKLTALKFIEVDPDKKRAKSVAQLKRLPGSDILILGCANLIFIYSHADRNFTMLKNLEVHDCSDIIDIYCINNKLFLLDDQGTVFVKAASCRIDMDEARLRGALLSLRVRSGRLAAQQAQGRLRRRQPLAPG